MPGSENQDQDEAVGGPERSTPEPELETLQRELESLRAELAASQARELALRATVALFRGGLDAISDAINIRGSDHQHLYANPVALAWMDVAGIEHIEHAERRWRYLHEDEQTPVKPEEAPTRRALKGEAMADIVALHIDDNTGARRWIHGSAAPIHDDSGACVGIVNLVRDISVQRANEQALARRTDQLDERDAEKAALIGELEAMVLELSAPALEVWDGILVVPVLGKLDARRGRDLLEGTLNAVRDTKSRAVIVDLTGARVDSASSAQQLARLTRALALLGARCVLAGIRPALALFLTEQDLVPEGVQVYGNLKYALRGLLGATGSSGSSGSSDSGPGDRPIGRRD